MKNALSKGEKIWIMYMACVELKPWQTTTVNDLINAYFQINASYLINAPSTMLKLYLIGRLSLTDVP